MARRPSRQSLSTGILIVLLAGVLVGQTLGASANHAPANKVVAAGDNLTRFGPGTEQTLLTTVLKTSKPTDLMLQVTAECSILTKLHTAGGNNPPAATETDKASGDVRIWIEATMEGVTRIVPIVAKSEPPQDGPENGSDPNSGTKAADSATFCNRTYERKVTDEEEGDDGIDGESDYIDTKTANAFNWLYLNTGSGMHTLEVKADITASSATQAGCTPDTVTDQTCSYAYVGNRTFIVEPTKMSNDTTVAIVGTT